jgi:hypothetical protein
MPALPLDEAGKYVAGAYIVFTAVIVIYVSIMATKLRGLEARWRRLEEANPTATEAAKRDAANQQGEETARTGSTGEG